MAGGFPKAPALLAACGAFPRKGRGGEQRPQAMGRFRGEPPQPCPVGAPLEKIGRSGWPAEGLWGYQERQMGQNLPLCGQLGAARSRQDESKEVRLDAA
jgi:hypothetical protein